MMKNKTILVALLAIAVVVIVAVGSWASLAAEYKTISFDVKMKRSVHIDDFDMIYPDFSIALNPGTNNAITFLNEDLHGRGEQTETLLLEDNKFYFQSPHQPRIEIPLSGILPLVEDKKPVPYTVPLIVKFEGNGKKYKVIIEKMTLRDYGKDDRRIQSIQGHLLVRFAV